MVTRIPSPPRVRPHGLRPHRTSSPARAPTGTAGARPSASTTTTSTPGTPTRSTSPTIRARTTASESAGPIAKGKASSPSTPTIAKLGRQPDHQRGGRPGPGGDPLRGHPHPPAEPFHFLPARGLADQRQELPDRCYSHSKNETIGGIGDRNLPSRGYDSSNFDNNGDLTFNSILGKAVNEVRMRYGASRARPGRAESGGRVDRPGRFLGRRRGGGIGDRRLALRAVGRGLLGYRRRVPQRLPHPAQHHRRSEQQQLRRGGDLRGRRRPQLDANFNPVLGADGNPILGPVDSIGEDPPDPRAAGERPLPSQIRLLGGGPSQYVVAGGNPNANVAQTHVGVFLMTTGRSPTAWSWAWGFGPKPRPTSPPGSTSLPAFPSPIPCG